jgi:hypothetical protein
MQDTAQWTIILVWIAVGAAFTHHYKTAGACFVGVFALAMFPGGVHVDPLAAGVVIFYGGAALMGGYILLQIWRWCGKDGW